MAIVADLGTLQRLPGIVGRGHARDLIYTGRDIDAERAGELGLVLPDREGLEVAALELAHEIAAISPLVVRGTQGSPEVQRGQ